LVILTTTPKALVSITIIYILKLWSQSTLIRLFAEFYMKSFILSYKMNYAGSFSLKWEMIFVYQNIMSNIVSSISFYVFIKNV
jgi:hypothetical protein